MLTFISAKSNTWTNQGTSIILIVIIALIVQVWRVDACCDPIKPIDDFEPQKFAGIWYVVHTDMLQDEKNCYKLVFGFASSINASNTSYTSTSTFKPTTGGQMQAVTEILTLPGDNEFGYWARNDSRLVNVVATDYATYGVLANCYSRFGPSVWVLTRNQQRDSNITSRIVEALDMINLSSRSLRQIKFDAATCGATYLGGSLFANFFLLAILSISLFSNAFN